MGMSKCYSLLKCLVIFFDIIFLTVGVAAIALAGVGVWQGVGEGTGAAGLGAVGAWGAGAAGGAAAGLAGAGRGAASLLAGSFSLLALCAVGEAAAVWWGAAHHPLLTAALHSRLHHMIVTDYGHDHTTTQIVDTMQQELECCGVDSPRDWSRSWWSAQQQPQVEVDPRPDDPRPVDPHTVAETRTATLDLTLSAPTQYYYMPDTCCQKSSDCPVRVSMTDSLSGVGGCWPSVEAALSRWGRGAGAVGATLLAAHGALLLATLALALSDHPQSHYKA